MLIKNPHDRNFSAIKPSEITSESTYLANKLEKQALLSRRKLLTGSAMALGGLALGSSFSSSAKGRDKLAQLPYRAADASSTNGFYTPEALTPYSDVTTYNNFYEFGTAKSDPAKNAHRLITDPWSVKIEGEVNKPGTYTLEDILKPHDLEERIYRLRCVEAWSMVIPWIGFPLADLIKRFEPSSNAKYVAFETLKDRKNMVGMRSAFSTIDWPYVEGLRMDEAMHPLTILAVGLYGKELPKQNGAPLRLVVPWKYGFKSIKSIVNIRFTKRRPPTSWNRTAPKEYGFYSNVNPAVDHPRWSQATERRLPSSLFNSNRIETLPFNGYADQVAGLYSDMNLRKYF